MSSDEDSESGNSPHAEGDVAGASLHLVDDPSTPREHSDGEIENEQKFREFLREQDRFLPIANISRIMKRVLPESGKVAKDAKECCQECVSELISFITSEASERCQNEKRKTINGEDILWAMQQLGFDQYVEPLKLYLAKYREAAKCERVATAGMATSAINEDFLGQAAGPTVVTFSAQPPTTSSVGYAFVGGQSGTGL